MNNCKCLLKSAASHIITDSQLGHTCCSFSVMVTSLRKSVDNMEDVDVDVDEIEREKSIEERYEADGRAWFAKRQQSGAPSKPGWFILQLENFLLKGNVKEGDW